MAEPTAPERLIDPDCRDGKHGSCVGDPCECACHIHYAVMDPGESDEGPFCDGCGEHFPCEAIRELPDKRASADDLLGAIRTISAASPWTTTSGTPDVTTEPAPEHTPPDTVDDREIVVDGFGGRWVKHGPGCDMQVVRPGKVQCSCDPERTPPDDTTAPVTAEGLTSPAVVGPAYAAVYEVIRKWPGTAERNTVIWRAVQAYQAALMVDPATGQHPLEPLIHVRCTHERHQWMCVNCAADAMRPEVERMQAEVAARDADLDSLRARITVLQDREEEALDPLRTQVAALQRELAEVKAERDTNFSVLQRVSKGGWESATGLVNERIARQQAERELAEAKQAVYTTQITHIRERHPNWPHIASCSGCQVLVPLSLAMPARPDDPDEIRRLMQATTEEKSDD